MLKQNYHQVCIAYIIFFALHWLRPFYKDHPDFSLTLCYIHPTDHVWYLLSLGANMSNHVDSDIYSW